MNGHAGLASARPSRAAAPLIPLFVVGSVLLGIYQQVPPGATPADAPATQFSSARAMRHVRAIAAEPHPVGSAAHDAVRDYISGELNALGLEPEIQEATSVSTRFGTPYPAARVQNIAARIKGTGTGKAVMLVGHYDSAASSLGASDDGAGVAAILETARAVRAGSPLKRDLILLFTDGEEPGLLGAETFAGEHPWMREVGLVLNFEARGNAGPSIMFETSDGNGRLISDFAEAAPHPNANSLSYEIYRLLPNNTDLKVFKEQPLAALNFAYIGGVAYYHTRLDSADNLDERSLQHHGSYALAAARYFGDLGAEIPREPNAVYFSLVGPRLIHYPGRLVPALALLVTLLLAGVIALGLRRRLLSFRGMAYGLLLMLLSMAAAWACAALVWWAARAVIDGGWIYRGGALMFGFVLLTCAVTSALFALFRRRTSAHNLAAGALLWWEGLMLLSSLFVPGGSYLFTFPLLFGAAGLALMLAARRDGPLSPWLVALLCLCAVPGLLLLTQLIYQLYFAMTLALVGPMMVLVALLSGLLLPQLELLAPARRLLLPGALAVLGLLLIIVGGATSGFDRGHPKPDGVFYVLNADTGRAVWATADERRDEWTSQFISADAQTGSLADYVPLTYKGFKSSPAPAASLAAPEATLLEQNTSGGTRTLRLRINSPRGAPYISIDVDPGAELTRATVDGKPVSTARTAADPGSRWGVRYYNVRPEGLEVSFETGSQQPFKLRVADCSAGLPQLPGSPFRARTEATMTEAFFYADTTSVSKTFVF